MPRVSPEQRAHRNWLALIRPTGLVVAAPALARAAGGLEARDVEGQRRLREWRDRFADDTPSSSRAAFRAFAESVLDWDFSPRWYGAADRDAGSPIPTAALPEYGETLFADFAVREPDTPETAPPEGGPPWQVAVSTYGPEQDLDARFTGAGRLEDSPNGRLERLLRKTRTPAGVLFNSKRLRLVSAPYGESSGFMDFVLDELAETAGRPLVAALRLLLGQDRLLTATKNQRLPTLLSDSRKYQNEVSERLAGQVLHGLYDLLRGIQAADGHRGGALLRHPLQEHRDKVYRALLAVILRLVFLLYAEQRGLLPDDESFVRHYSLMALFERLRADEAFHPDTMDQRYGAWAHLLALFRMVHDGARSGSMRLPPRHGALFNPDEYPFLEGRMAAGGRQLHERIEPPLVSDGTVLAVLKKLLVLDGERISYRALDVEQIGSVYETMMGFRLETAAGPSVAVKSPKKHGAPSVVNLEDATRRALPITGPLWVQQATDRKLTDRVLKAVAAATSVERLHAALDPVVDRSATPDIAEAGAILLQPNEERRRSGSHYTPRALTGPIVRRTLEPDPRPAARGRRRKRSAPGGDPRPQGLRSRDGFRGFPGGGVPPVGRRAHRGVEDPRRTLGNSVRRGRNDLRASPRRPEMSLRRGPEPARGGPRQAVPLARYAGEGPPAHLRGPRPARRGFAGGVVP